LHQVCSYDQFCYRPDSRLCSNPQPWIFQQTFKNEKRRSAFVPQLSHRKVAAVLAGLAAVDRFVAAVDVHGVLRNFEKICGATRLQVLRTNYTQEIVRELSD
jgi:hypothetical protein